MFPYIHNPHPETTHDYHRYNLIFKTLKRRFLQLNKHIETEDDLILAWADFLDSILAKNAAGDVFFGVASREKAFIATEKRKVFIKQNVEKNTNHQSKKNKNSNVARPNTTKISSNVRKRIIKEDKVCRYCMNDQMLTVDHIIPRSRGGSNNDINLVAACYTCNQEKGSKTPKQAKMKLYLPPRFFTYINQSNNT